MSHWDFAGTGQDDPYAEDAAGWPAGSFPALFPDDRDQGSAAAAEPDDGPAVHGGPDPDASRPPGEDWDAADGGYAGDFRPGQDRYAGEGREDDDDGEALYPLTYERTDDPADASPAAPAGPDVAGGAQDGTGAPAGPMTASGYWAGAGRGKADGTGELTEYGAGAAGANGEAVERERTGRRGQAPPLFGSPGRAAVPPPAPGSPPPQAGPAGPPPAWMDWELGPDQRHRRRRVGRPVLLVAGVAVVAAAGAGTAVLASGHPGRLAAAPAASDRPAAGPAASGTVATPGGSGGTGPGAASPVSTPLASAPPSRPRLGLVCRGLVCRGRGSGPGRSGGRCRPAQPGPGPGGRRGLHDGEQRGQRGPEQFRPGGDRDRVQRGDRRVPVPAGTGGGNGPLPRLRPGPVGLLPPPG